MNLPADTKSSSIVLKSIDQTLVFDPTKDINVSIDYSFFQSTSTIGGGFCIFFIADSNSQIVSGAPGPGLGYTTISDYSYNGITNFPGTSASYIAVGVDVDGYFAVSGTNINGGYTYPSPNSITVRGGENDNYSLLGNSGDLRNYPNIEYPNSQSLTLSTTQNEYKTIRISLLNFSSTVLVEFKDEYGVFKTYYQQNLNLPRPQNKVRAGLSYSTGLSGNNNLWIKGINFCGSQGNYYGSNTPLITSNILDQVDNTIYLSLTEDNQALSTYSVLNGYLYYVVDPNTFIFTSYYYSNTAEGLSSYTLSESGLPVISGGNFNDYENGYFNYVRYYSATVPELISEFDTIIFNLTAIQDSTFNITKITLDKFGNNSVLISAVKNFYITYNDTSALAIATETNNYTSPKFTLLETTYQTENSSFSTTYTPIISVFRDNGVIDVIDITLTVAKQSFNEITQDFRIIDTYQFNDKIVIKMQNPLTNQIYFTSLSTG